MSTGLIAVGVAGGALLLVTLADIFVAVFNYDGFTFLTARMHRLAWAGLRRLAREASGVDGDRCSGPARAYQRYREWLPFHCRRHVFIARVSTALGYSPPTAGPIGLLTG